MKISRKKLIAAVPLMSEKEILMMGKNEFIVKTNAIPPIKATLDFSGIIIS